MPERAQLDSDRISPKCIHIFIFTLNKLHQRHRRLSGFCTRRGVHRPIRTRTDSTKLAKMNIYIRSGIGLQQQPQQQQLPITDLCASPVSSFSLHPDDARRSASPTQRAVKRPKRPSQRLAEALSPRSEFINTCAERVRWSRTEHT